MRGNRFILIVVALMLLDESMPWSIAVGFALWMIAAGYDAAEARTRRKRAKP